MVAAILDFASLGEVKLASELGGFGFLVEREEKEDDEGLQVLGFGVFSFCLIGFCVYFILFNWVFFV